MTECRLITSRKGKPVAILATDGTNPYVLEPVTDNPLAVAAFRLGLATAWAQESDSRVVDHPQLESFGLRLAATMNVEQNSHAAVNSAETRSDLIYRAYATELDDPDEDDDFATDEVATEDCGDTEMTLVTDVEGAPVAVLAFGLDDRQGARRFVYETPETKAAFDLGIVAWKTLGLAKEFPLGALEPLRLAVGDAVAAEGVDLHRALSDPRVLGELRAEHPLFFVEAFLLGGVEGGYVTIVLRRGSHITVLDPFYLEGDEVAIFHEICVLQGKGKLGKFLDNPRSSNFANYEVDVLAKRYVSYPIGAYEDCPMLVGALASELDEMMCRQEDAVAPGDGAGELEWSVLGDASPKPRMEQQCDVIEICTEVPPDSRDARIETARTVAAACHVILKEAELLAQDAEREVPEELVDTVAGLLHEARLCEADLFPLGERAADLVGEVRVGIARFVADLDMDL